MMKLTVIGCGYLGAVHAACMAQLGHDVVGIDVDAPKVELLAAGGPRSSNPASKRCCRRLWPAAGSRSRRTWRRHADDRCISSASAPRKSAMSTPPTWRTSMRQSTHWRRTCRPATWWSASRPCRSAPPRRLAELVAEPSPAALLAWNPEFLREGHAVAGHPAPGPAGVRASGGADGELAPDRCWTRCTRRRWRPEPRWW